MNKYTVYCTSEQTKKALKLGMPIEMKYGTTNHIPSMEELKYLLSYDGWWYKIPTADQMINRLEEEGIVVIFMATMKEDLTGYTWIAHICHFEDKSVWVDSKGLSRKEATLAAIDAALEYLENNEKIKSKNSTV